MLNPDPAASNVPAMPGPIVLHKLFQLSENPDSISWEPFREGVRIHWLYQTDESGPAAALIRFQPGAKVAPHEHTGFEHILVLSGSQRDENGTISAGSLLIHKPGTRHSIVSEEGCIVLAIYEKRVWFV